MRSVGVEFMYRHVHRYFFLFWRAFPQKAALSTSSELLAAASPQVCAATACLQAASVLCKAVLSAANAPSATGAVKATVAGQCQTVLSSVLSLPAQLAVVPAQLDAIAQFAGLMTLIPVRFLVTVCFSFCLAVAHVRPASGLAVGRTRSKWLYPLPYKPLSLCCPLRLGDPSRRSCSRLVLTLPLGRYGQACRALCPAPFCVMQLETSVHQAAAQCLLSLAKTCAQLVLRTAPHVFEKLRGLALDTSVSMSPGNRLVVLEVLLTLAGSLPPAEHLVGWWNSCLLLHKAYAPSLSLVLLLVKHRIRVV